MLDNNQEPKKPEVAPEGMPESLRLKLGLLKNSEDPAEILADPVAKENQKKEYTPKFADNVNYNPYEGSSVTEHTRKDTNFDRFYNWDYERLGFSPNRNNDEFYNKHTTTLDKTQRALKGSWFNASIGFVDNLTGWYDWDPTDSESAGEMDEVMNLYSDTSDGPGAFFNNLVLNGSYTIGMMTEMALEEMLLTGLTAVTLGGSSGIQAASLAKNANSVRKLISTYQSAKKVKQSYKTIDNTLDMLEATNDVSKMRKAFNWTKRVVNPFDNTQALVKNWDNIGDGGKGMATFSAVYKDAKMVQTTMGEAFLEGGFVSNKVKEELISKKQEEKFKLTGSRELTLDEYNSIDIIAEDQGRTAVALNTPLLFVSNKIVLDGFFKVFAPKYTKPALKIGNETVRVTGKAGSKSIELLSDGTKWQRFKSFSARKFDPINYIKGNFTEGIQEVGQEIIQEAVTEQGISRGLTGDTEPGSVFRGDLWSQIASSSSKFMSVEGLKIFGSGFLTGGMVNQMTGLTSAAKTLAEDAASGDMGKLKKEIAKQNIRNQFRVNELIMNNPEVYLSKQLNTSKELLELEERKKQALKNDDYKTYKDITDIQRGKHVIQSLHSGGFDLVVEQAEAFDKLTDEELATMYKTDLATIKKDGKKIREGLKSFKEEAKSIKKRFDNTTSLRKKKPAQLNQDEFAEALLKREDKLTQKEKDFFDYLMTEKMVDDYIIGDFQVEQISKRIKGLHKEILSDPFFNRINQEELQAAYDDKAADSLKKALKAELKANKLTERAGLDSDIVKDLDKRKDVLTKKLDALVKLDKANKSNLTKITKSEKTNKENLEAYNEILVEYLSEIRKGSELEQGLSPHTNDQIRKNISKVVDSIMDVRDLGRDQKGAIDFINLITDSRKGKSYKEHLKKELKKNYKKRNTKLKRDLKELHKSKFKNELLNTLADSHGVYISDEEIVDLINNGIVPKVLLDVKTLKPIDENSSTYKVAIAEIKEALDAVEEIDAEIEAEIKEEEKEVVKKKKSLLDRIKKVFRKRTKLDENEQEIVEIEEDLNKADSKEELTIIEKEIAEKEAKIKKVEEEEQKKIEDDLASSAVVDDDSNIKTKPTDKKEKEELTADQLQKTLNGNPNLFIKLQNLHQTYQQGLIEQVEKTGKPVKAMEFHDFIQSGRDDVNSVLESYGVPIYKNEKDTATKTPEEESKKEVIKRKNYIVNDELSQTDLIPGTELSNDVKNNKVDSVVLLSIPKIINDKVEADLLIKYSDGVVSQSTVEIKPSQKEQEAILIAKEALEKKKEEANEAAELLKAEALIKKAQDDKIITPVQNKINKLENAPLTSKAQRDQEVESLVEEIEELEVEESVKQELLNNLNEVILNFKDGDVEVNNLNNERKLILNNSIESLLKDKVSKATINTIQGLQTLAIGDKVEFGDETYIKAPKGFVIEGDYQNITDIDLVNIILNNNTPNLINALSNTENGELVKITGTDGNTYTLKSVNRRKGEITLTNVDTKTTIKKSYIEYEDFVTIDKTEIAKKANKENKSSLFDEVDDSKKPKKKPKKKPQPTQQTNERRAFNSLGEEYELVGNEIYYKDNEEGEGGLFREYDTEEEAAKAFKELSNEVELTPQQKVALKKMQKLYPEIKIGFTQDGKSFEVGDGKVVMNQEQLNQINYSLKSVDILSTDKAKQIFEKGKKNGWDLNDILTKLQIPKEHKQIILNSDFGGFYTDELSLRENIIMSLLTNNTFVVEVNTAKEPLQDYEMVDETGEGDFQPRQFIPDTEIITEEDEEGNVIGVKERLSEKGKKQIEERENKRKPTQYNSNRTVSGGVNYTENEIAIPGVIPNIKGHADFSTDNGIGWFRSDEQVKEGSERVKDQKAIEEEIRYYETLVVNREAHPEDLRTLNQLKEGTYKKEDATKTRRILEVQSDLFQKGRKRTNLVGEIKEDEKFYEDHRAEAFSYNLKKEGDRFYIYQYSEGTEEQYDSYATIEEARTVLKELNEELEKERDVTITTTDNSKNQFLQLLNKENTWVNFFIQSIVQDSVKKGYKKVLFPKGDTAAKVQGHATLEEFKKQKEDSIKELEKQKGYLIDDKIVGNSFYINNTKVFYLTKNIGHTKDGFARYSNKDEIPDTKNASGVGFKYVNVSNEDSKVFNKDKAKIEEDIQKTVPINNKITKLKQELERVETEGFGALKPIYNFYEKAVTNILNKLYNTKQVTDEHGNTWTEVTLSKKQEEEILLQQDEKGNIKGQANIDAMSVLFDKTKMSDDTIYHEYAHHYIAWNRNSPIVQEAIKKWGSEEALVQAIGEQSLKQNGEALTWFTKFIAWLKNDITKLKKLDAEKLKNILTDAFLTRQALLTPTQQTSDVTIEGLTKSVDANITGGQAKNADGTLVYGESRKNVKIGDKLTVKITKAEPGKKLTFEGSDVEYDYSINILNSKGEPIGYYGYKGSAANSILNSVNPENAVVLITGIGKDWISTSLYIDDSFETTSAEEVIIVDNATDNPEEFEGLIFDIPSGTNPQTQTLVDNLTEIGEKLDSGEITVEMGSLRAQVAGRLVVDFITSDGQRFLMYKSKGTGTGVESKGLWVPIPGFTAKEGFFIKTLDKNNKNPKFTKYNSETFKKVADTLSKTEDELFASESTQQSSETLITENDLIIPEILKDNEDINSIFDELTGMQNTEQTDKDGGVNLSCNS